MFPVFAVKNWQILPVLFVLLWTHSVVGGLMVLMDHIAAFYSDSLSVPLFHMDVGKSGRAIVSNATTIFILDSSRHPVFVSAHTVGSREKPITSNDDTLHTITGKPLPYCDKLIATKCTEKGYKKLRLITVTTIKETNEAGLIIEESNVFRLYIVNKHIDYTERSMQFGFLSAHGGVRFMKADDNQLLYVLNETALMAIDLRLCEKATSCEECTELDYHYCGWCTMENTCSYKPLCHSAKDNKNYEDYWVRSYLRTPQDCPIIKQIPDHDSSSTSLYLERFPVSGQFTTSLTCVYQPTNYSLKISKPAITSVYSTSTLLVKCSNNELPRISPLLHYKNLSYTKCPITARKRCVHCSTGL